jgi:uncharacterized protein (DUF1501 family)
LLKSAAKKTASSSDAYKALRTKGASKKRPPRAGSAVVRSAKENGNRGTDHGHANCMFVMGGNVKGGAVYGRWLGLNDHQLNEGRGLALATDFRHVVGEALTKHIGVKDLSAVFPGFDNNPRKFPGLIRT